ncbi:MAG: putative lipid II flippase FtsW, partial [Nitrospinota bacterium]
MVNSSSAIVALERFKDPYYFVKRQTAWLLVGLGAMGCAAVVNLEGLKRWTGPAVVVVAVLLGLVLFPGLGRTVSGARRWLAVGPLSVQPSEFAKLVCVLYLARWLADGGDCRREAWSTYLQAMVVPGLLVALVLVEPDLGTAVLIGAVAMVMLILGGVPWSFLLGVAAAAVPVLAAAALSAGYRRRRLLAFLNPWADPSGTGFQMVQSYLALGRGGLFGQGLGQSTQKLFYLPEAHTDFIFAVLGEELGFVGAAGVGLLFAILVWRGFRLASSHPQAYGAYLAGGCTTLIALQALINMGVVVGLLPTKGLPLPFISLGGSSLVVTCLAVGLLLNLSRRAAPSGGRS